MGRWFATKDKAEGIVLEQDLGEAKVFGGKAKEEDQSDQESLFGIYRGVFYEGKNFRKIFVGYNAQFQLSFAQSDCGARVCKDELLMSEPAVEAVKGGKGITLVGEFFVG